MPKNLVKLTETRLVDIIREVISKTSQAQNEENNIDIEKIFHLSSIPDNELRKQYIDLSFTVSSSGYGGKFMGVNGDILKEDATETVPIEETCRQMRSKFNLKEWQVAEQTVANGIRLVILYPGIFKNTRLIKNAMLACGWTLAFKGFAFKDGMLWRAMSFGPLFQDDVSDETRKYRYLFHWTSLYNLNSIKNNGLQPRSENKLYDYPDRLHLIKGDTPDDMIFDIGMQLCAVNTRRKNNGKYVLLAIDLDKVSSETEIYYDPRYEWGYYDMWAGKATTDVVS